MFENLEIVTNRKSRSGTLLQNESFTEEYLAQLRGELGYDVYDKMRRSDYQVQRALRVLYTPILSGKFEVLPLDSDDEEQKKQATYKNNFYKKYQQHKWVKTLIEVLSQLPFGFALFEPTFHSVEDPELGNIVTLKSLGYIKQRTIKGWKVKDGEIDSIHQVVYGENSIDDYISGDRLICFTNMQEGDNFEGISIIRSAYGCYIRKDLFLKLDMIGNEKMSVGTPIFYVPTNILNNSKELGRIEAIGEAYTGHQKAVIVLPDALKDGGFEIKKGEYNSDATNNSISREDRAIVDLILASFLQIGIEKAGGNSQNEGQMQLFLNSLLSVAEYIGEVLSDLAHKMYVLNFGEPETRLDITVSGIVKDDARTTMEILRGYSSAGLIMGDDMLEKRIRKEHGLPEMDIETRREIHAIPSQDDEESGGEPRKKQDSPENPSTEESEE